MGKNQIDAWNKDKVYADRPTVKGEEGMTLSDMFFQTKSTPLDFVITNDFLDSLSPKEASILEDISAGYKIREICERHSITVPLFNNIRKAVQEKAVDYL